MAKDMNTSKFVVTITVGLQPVNRYGDVLEGGGTIHYTKTLEVKNMVELGVYLERLSDKPFEYIQMVDPPAGNAEADY
jgi:hypothetical protein